ncbi:lytic polysaccharide mono-oxygenase, cellulose-degrading domain-containing protein [Ditylenchus destructor]|nr:lytic polysaccharide mono-oxygenase, cellulose-degrading domain-containing protein [Ditylenchus destructor]
MKLSLPKRSGKHVIFSAWQRSDSTEAFYACSDVDFGGGSTPPGNALGPEADRAGLGGAGSADGQPGQAARVQRRGQRPGDHCPHAERGGQQGGVAEPARDAGESDLGLREGGQPAGRRGGRAQRGHGDGRLSAERQLGRELRDGRDPAQHAADESRHHDLGRRRELHRGSGRELPGQAIPLPAGAYGLRRRGLDAGDVADLVAGGVT